VEPLGQAQQYFLLEHFIQPNFMTGRQTPA
jgi:hypothetical protein